MSTIRDASQIWCALSHERGTILRQTGKGAQSILKSTYLYYDEPLYYYSGI